MLCTVATLGSLLSRSCSTRASSKLSQTMDANRVDSTSALRSRNSVSTDGNYKLELVLPRLTWNVGDPISGTAILSLTDSQPTKVTGASELIAFAFDEVGGIRHVAPIWGQSCSEYPLDPATPQSVAIYKSGAFQGNEPDADFLRTFFADPEIHLPAGTWDITAIASFSESGCAAPNRTIQATVRIHVTG